ncbi:MAG: hypothetical protein WC708_15195 [Lentisphaeria bacterium]
MSQETPQKIKLTVKTTGSDTSRLKSTPKLPPRPAISLPPAAAPAAADVPVVPAEAAAAKTVGVKDPLSLRDTNTSRLKRIKVDGQGQAGATVVVTPTGGSGDKTSSTETVRLKIIREKRPGAVGPAASNQTIRLRPPGGAAAAPAEAPTLATQPGPAAETVRVDAPPAPPAAAGSKISTATIKLRPGALPAPAAPVIALPEAAPEAAPAATGSAKHTIKIKMPAPGTAAAAPDSGATLRMPPPPEAGATLKLPEEQAATSKRTLKFKTPKAGAVAVAPDETAAAPAAAAAAVAAASVRAQGGAGETDRVALAACVVTILSLGTALGVLVVQTVRYYL